VGYQAVVTRSPVTFEKHLYRDGRQEKILDELEVVEGDAPYDTTVHNRNLILVSRFPDDYSVEFFMN